MSDAAKPDAAAMVSAAASSVTRKLDAIDAAAWYPARWASATGNGSPPTAATSSSATPSASGGPAGDGASDPTERIRTLGADERPQRMQSEVNADFADRGRPRRVSDEVRSPPHRVGGRCDLTIRDAQQHDRRRFDRYAAVTRACDAIPGRAECDRSGTADSSGADDGDACDATVRKHEEGCS